VAATQLRDWFENEGWRLEPGELRAALTMHGADEETIADLVDEGADRRHRQPLEEREPEAHRGDNGTVAANVSAATTGEQPSRSSNGSEIARRADANVVPITEAPSHGNVPPQNLEAEESVLGAMMISQGAVDAVSEVLSPDGSDFYRPSHALIYKAALAIVEAGERVDVISLADKLEQQGCLDGAGGKIRLHELAGLVPDSVRARHYAAIVKENATLRGLIRAGGEITRLGWDRPGDATELVDQAQQITLELGDDVSGPGIEHVEHSVVETFRRMTARAESDSEYVGVPSGLHDLDELTAGFEPGNLIIVAARPSMGKSALVHTFLANITIRQRRPVGLFTAEMSKGEVTQRLLAREAKVDGQRIRKAKQLDGVEWTSLARAADTLKKAPFYHDDRAQLGLAHVRSESRRLKKRHPDLALIAVDYLQLMSSEGENRTQEVSKLSRGLKILARDLNVPVIALSQLSRAVEQRADKRPILSDLRESGTIEQDADLVMFLYRDEYYNDDSDARGVAEIDLAKHRNGPTDRIKVAFQKRWAGFSDLAPVHTPGVFG
jgi:replicative DNA helicase